ncbi:helix-turn-helix domain protein [Brachyspira sp. CAG:484]|nr:helix-turn-helix domain protein [Brachyspira sp. CAG:484]
MSKSYKLRYLFAEKIKKLRTERKLTQAQLAEKVSVEPKHISCIENGLSFPSVDLIARLAKAFEMPPYELFLFEAKPECNVLKNEIIKILNNASENQIEKIYLYTKFVTTS